MEPKNVPKIAQSIFSGRSFVRSVATRIAPARGIPVHSTLARGTPARLFLFGCNSPASACTGKRRAIIAVLHHL